MPRTRATVRQDVAESVHQYYDSEDADYRQCHVTGSFFLQETVEVAPAVPAPLWELDLPKILNIGHDPATIHRRRNFLCLHRDIKLQLDIGGILIVAIDSLPVEFKFVVVDEALLRPEMGDWRKINGRLLRFRRKRPSMTGLWLRFLAEYLKTDRQGRELIEDALRTHGIAQWYSPTPLTHRRGVLREAASRLGVDFWKLKAICGNAIAREDDGLLDPEEQEVHGEALARQIMET